jgi:hypothetical protein
VTCPIFSNFPSAMSFLIFILIDAPVSFGWQLMFITSLTVKTLSGHSTFTVGLPLLFGVLSLVFIWLSLAHKKNKSIFF